MRTYRKDGICPRCGVNPRAVRPDGRPRGWCRPCETDQKIEYLRTEAGKATMRRYAVSAKGKATHAKGQVKRRQAIRAAKTPLTCWWCGGTTDRIGGTSRAFDTPECAKRAKQHLWDLTRAGWDVTGL